MAEAVALAASIAGLTSLAIQLTQISYHYVSDLRDASKAVLSYIRELSALTSVLLRLQEVLEIPDVTNLLSSRPSSLSKQSMDIYMAEITAVKSGLEKRASKTGLSAKLKSLSWPLEEKETKRSVDTLHRIHGLLNSALSADIFVMSVANFQEVKSMKRDGVHRDILNWLSPGGGSKSINEIFTTLHPGTGQWLFKKKEYLNWTIGQGNLLWCYGAPGTGKSVLASLIVHEVAKQSTIEDVAVVSYFCDYQNQKDQTTENILRNLIKQVAEPKKTFPQALISFYEDCKSSQQVLGIPKLERLLRDLCNETPTTFLVVDGLDELVQRAKIISVLQSLSKSGVRVLVTSRPFPDIQTAFKSNPNMEIRAMDVDVREYIESRFQESEDLIELTTDMLRESFKATIVDRANGMFLLVRMIMDRLTTLTTVKEIRLGLEKMPSDLTELFEKTMIRIKQQSPNRAKLAQSALEWVSNAKRPLTIEELRHALAVEEGSTAMDIENLSLAKMIVSVCHGLLVIDNQNKTVRLVHFTVHDFLLHHWNFNEAQVFLSKTCLTYLSFDTLQSGECKDALSLKTRITEMPLLAYAAKYWGEHVREVEADIQEIVIKFLKSKNLMAAVFQAMNFRPNSSHFQPSLQAVAGSLPTSHLPLNLAAYWGLVITARLLPSEDKEISLPDADGWTPLHWAASNGHQDVVQFLVEKKADLEVQDTQGWTPLFWATLKNHYEIVSFLLGCNANISHRDKSEWTALHWATTKGDDQMIQILLDHRSDPKAYFENNHTILLKHLSVTQAKSIIKDRASRASNKNFTELARTPLEIAAQNGDRTAFELLVKAGLADTISPDDDMHNYDSDSDHIFDSSSSLFRNLFWRQGPDVSKLLRAIRKGGDLLVKGTPYTSGMQMSQFHLKLLDQAIKDEQFEIVKLLLMEEGVSIGSNYHPGSKSRTPLHLAAYCRNPKIAELLIQSGLDACAGATGFSENGEGYENSTLSPLHLAAKNGFEATVKVLARDGKAVNLRDDEGCTPLHLVWDPDNLRQQANGLANIGVATVLIEHGADVHATDANGDTSLHYAVSDDYPPAVSFLLSQGALSGPRNRMGETCLHVLAGRNFSYSQPVLDGRTSDIGRELCDLLLANAQDDILDLETSSTSSFGANKTALQIALENSNWTIAVALHHRGGTLSDSFVFLGPLYSAVLAGALVAVELLIKLGANIGALSPKLQDPDGSSIPGRINEDEDRRVPFLLQATVNYLGLRGRPSVRGRWNRTKRKKEIFMNRIPVNGYMGTIELLVKAGVDVNVSDLQGKTPLHIAASSVYSAGVAEILLQSGGNVHAADQCGLTPLHEAAMSGSSELIRLLLAYGADTKAVTVDKLYPIDLAMRDGNEAVVRVLLENREERYPDSAIDYLGTAVFLNALEAYNVEYAEGLVKNGLDIHFKNAYGRSPLHKAAEIGSDKVTLWLLKQGLSVEGSDASGLTPLHFAAWAGHVSVIEILLEHGAKIQATTIRPNREGWMKYSSNSTALHLAASQGHERVCRILLDWGADLEAEMIGYMTTALSVAINASHMNVVELLLERGAQVGETGARLRLERVTAFEGHENAWKKIQAGSPDSVFYA